jgi:hypothetical protein
MCSKFGKSAQAGNLKLLLQIRLPADFKINVENALQVRYTINMGS